MLKCSSITRDLALSGEGSDQAEVFCCHSIDEWYSGIENLNKGFMNLSIQCISNDQWNQPDLNALMHANRGDWSLARSEYFEMGKRLVANRQLIHAFNMFLYVCALDLNGAQDCGDLSKSLQNKFPGFNANKAFLAPDVVEALRWTAEEIGIAMDDLRACFVSIASARFFPVTAQKSWSDLSFALQGKMDLDDQPRGYRQIRPRINEQKDDVLSRSAFHFLLSGIKSVLMIIYLAFIGGGRRNAQAVRLQEQVDE
jgi:hypothetical protein